MGLQIEHAYVGILTCDDCGRRLLLDVEDATLSDVLAMGWCVLHEPEKSDLFTCPECLRAEYVPVSEEDKGTR